MEHDALRVLNRAGDPMTWVLRRGDAEWEGVPPGRATANSPEFLMRMALAGCGIAIVNDHFAVRYLRAASSSKCCPIGACRPSIFGRCSPVAG